MYLLSKKTKNQRGLSFVELNVAIAVFLIAAVSIIGILAFCTTAAKKATDIAQCINLAKCKMAELIYMKANEINKVYEAALPSPFENYKYTVEKKEPTDPNLSATVFKELKITVTGITGTSSTLVGLLTRPFSWAKSYGSTKEDTQYQLINIYSTVSILPIANGGYVLATLSQSFSTDSFHNLWILKLDSSGDILQQKYYYIPHSVGTYSLNSIQKTRDGGYILTGYIVSGGIGYKFWVLKLDSSLRPEWQKGYGGMHYFWKSDIYQTDDEGYITSTNIGIDGNTYSNIWIQKLKAGTKGEIEWQRRYNEADTQILAGESIQQTKDKNYLVSAILQTSSAPFTVFFIFKIKDANPDEILWQKKFTLSEIINMNSTACTAREDKNDGGYIILVTVHNAFNYIIKLDADRNILWQKKYAYPCRINSISQTSDNYYIATGVYGTNLLLLKIDPSAGTIVQQKMYGKQGGDGGIGTSVWETSDNGYIMAGTTITFGAGSTDVLVVKTDPDTYCSPLLDKNSDITAINANITITDSALNAFTVTNPPCNTSLPIDINFTSITPTNITPQKQAP